MNDINDFTKKFTKERISNVVKVNRNFFQVNEELMNFKSKIRQEPFALGTYLGSGKPFHPSVALLDWLDKRTENYVIIDKKAAWLFLCGRDVFADSVIKQNINDGKLVLVKNENEEVLGLGEMTGRKVSIKNLLDKGDFLRRERH